MKFFSENLDDLRKLYVDQLRQLHSAENQIITALPKMIEASTAPELKEALRTHLEETKLQVSRLDQIFRELGEPADPKKCKGMAALLQEGEDLLTDATDDSVRDAGIICAAQKVEHYEMAAYGTVRTFAEVLGHEPQAELLEQTLDEEKNADAVLTSISDVANTKADRAA